MYYENRSLGVGNECRRPGSGGAGGRRDKGVSSFFPDPGKWEAGRVVGLLGDIPIRMCISPRGTLETGAEISCYPYLAYVSLALLSTQTSEQSSVIACEDGQWYGERQGNSLHRSLVLISVLVLLWRPLCRVAATDPFLFS